jgi:probable H4MPT-linked C1 transfer pathway protein
MTPPKILALDIGGANLKAADGAGYFGTRRFALWKNPHGLSDAIAALAAEAPRCDLWIVTMTGELCDCFRTKREGVAAIVDAVVAAAAGVEVLIYLVDGTQVSPDEAKRRFLEAAASNWHALTTFAARRVAPQAGVLLDIGSTTTDIISFSIGRPKTVGRTDPDRLASGELVYTGVVRSPICAVTPTLPWRGRVCGTAQELFATTLDAYLLLGQLPEDPIDDGTADGRPATREHARDRMARCVCADRDTFDDHDANQAAAVVRQAQVRRIGDAFTRVTQSMAEPPRTVVISGQGEFLARDVLRHIGWVGAVVSLSEELGPAASRVAPAYALAQLIGNADFGARPAKIESGPTVAPLGRSAAPTASPTSLATPAFAAPSVPAGPTRRSDLRVVKFGGSALSLETYAERLRAWLARQSPLGSIVVVGGGAEVRAIAQEQLEEHFSDVDAHWRCIGVMHQNAKELQSLMPGSKWLADASELPESVEPGSVWILDPQRFMQDDARTRSPLPESWDVSSDSIAARVAESYAVAELVLLKSRLPRSLRTLGEYVDPYFVAAARKLENIRFVNLRDANFADARWR